MKDDALKKRQRVAGICAMLARGETVRVADLAARYAVCEKSIRRDLDDIAAAGVQLVGGRGSWTLAGPPPRASIGLDLTMTEAVALCFALNCYQGIPSPPMATEVEKAVEKLKPLLPPGAEGIAAANCNRYSVSLATDSGSAAGQETIDTIEWALENSLVLRVRHTTPVAGDAAIDDIEPYALHFMTGHWYLIGRSRGHGEMTMMQVDLISECTDSGAAFERRADFSISDFLDHAWRTACGGLSPW